MSEAIIHIDQLAKKYKDADYFAVQALDLIIQKNEIFGMLGPNGAGKTTLISMLCGLLKPTSGSFEIDGLNYQNNRKQIQYLIGVVPQEYALYPTLTAFENLMYFGSMYGIKSDELKKKIDNSFSELGLTKFADKKIKSFSGGMKRRVNLIAGILHQPKVLFLDEPTVGVDVQSKNVIIQHLRKLNDSGTTIVYTSHHMIEAQEFCTDVAIIDHGKILVQGSPGDLIKSVKNAINLESVYLDLTGGELRDYA